MKRFLTLLLTLAMVLTFTVPALATSYPDPDDWTAQEILDKGGVPGRVNVLWQGQCIVFPDTQPKIVKGRTMIPIRAVMESMGAEVEYTPAGKIVEITMGDAILRTSVGSDTITVIRDGEMTVCEMDCASYIDGGRTMVPVRFISEAAGYTVLWDGDYKTAVVVDTAAEAAKIDSQFTKINDFLADQMAQQAGKNLAQTSSAAVSLTVYDEEGEAQELPVTLKADTYTDGAALRVDLSVDVSEAAATLLKNAGDLLEDVDLSALKGQDLSNIQAVLLIEEDSDSYLQCGLLNAMLGVNENAWIALAPETAFAASASTFTVGELLMTVLTLEDEDSFHFYDTLTVATDVLTLMLGDETGKTTGTKTSWGMDTDDLLALAGADTAEEFEGLNLDYTFSIDTKGAADMTFTVSMDTGMGLIHLDMTAASTDTDSEITLWAGMEDVLDVIVYATSRTETVAQLPSMKLPAGAEVVEA